ncbi:TRAP transporter small permease [Meridianimarinicoccus aquatilis]|uniref:TRAP transporter small permease protein n=1 Tax=Meridianimarinicoccus aquatilis TaxID=2552766 RepID=A0A4R6ANW0_9RHOB|nr:TRAP transporter small permease subunit [Fluviibacterium aquatile]QIE43059.1 TRAP transporter small permease subunit [Rhodobacteraceae bacterium SC52]TDL85132.1 TRAP transporter small permease subunit [Fluviibacterium aquatile]
MIGTILERVCLGLRVLIGVLTFALAIPVAAQVLARYTGIIPVYLWTEELATFIFVWVVMIGSMIAVWDNTHFNVEVIPEAKSALGALIQQGLVLVLIIIFGVFFAWYGVEYTKFGAIQNSVMLRANMAWTHISVPIAGAGWAVFAAYRLSELFKTYRLQRSAAQ